MEHDVIIVGGGAAGLNAALVLTRARRNVLVIDSGTPRNRFAGHLHGFLSRDGLPPHELLAIGRKEVEGYGGQFAQGEVTRVEQVEGGIAVTFGDRRVTALRALVTTGLTDELPAVEGLPERWGRDALHCPFCHGWEVRDQPLGVIGGTSRSVHQASLVSLWSPDVTLFTHTMPPLSEKDAAQLAERGVKVVDGVVERLVVEQDALTGVELADGSVVARSAVFVAPAMVGNLDFLKGVETETNEFFTRVVVDAMGRTSVPGLWAAGNVADPMAQLITAAAAGSAAAASIVSDLL
ncbi:NAD(P)/FAD-dependent oxidoreductase [Nonomuraea sp. NPDC050556]|uniref:NAD(P)/FAD-dependent oxidoreductase n=1 Tax=Nonomuraea sp. NPDC050556 TaxID=3364369 RepID=UPI0037A73EDF